MKRSRHANVRQAQKKRINRTGIATSPVDAQAAIEGARQAQPTSKPDGMMVMTARVAYAKEAEPIGTVPQPAAVKGVSKVAQGGLKGQRAAFLLDKLGERLASERTGVRLYDALLAAFDAQGSFGGGPARHHIERIRAQEAEHFAFLKAAIEVLGGDPSAVTPCADLVSVESAGLVQVLGDWRRSVPEALHAIHLFELADSDGWVLLTDLCEDLGQVELAEGCAAALAEEAEHLRQVRRWLRAHMQVESKVLGGVRQAARPS